MISEAPLLRDIKYNPRIGRESEEMYEDVDMPVSDLNERNA